MLGLIAAVVGVVGLLAATPHRVSCCLGPYLALSALLFTAQVGAVLYLFTSPEKATRSVADAWARGHPAGKIPAQKLHNAVYVGRWAALALLGAQVLAALAAILLRCCVKGAGKYESFTGDEAGYEAHLAANAAKMEELRADVLPKKSPPKAAMGVPMGPLGSSTSSRSAQYHADLERGNARIPAVRPGVPRGGGTPPPPQSAWSEAQRSGDPSFKPTWTKKIAK